MAETPLAGAPIRLVSALNKYSEVDARLINYNPKCYGERTFPEDLDWGDETQKAVAMDIIREADVFHVHHPIDVDSSRNVFGINFSEVNPSAKFLFQIHSDLKHFDEAKRDFLLNIAHQKCVIMHCPERDLIGCPVVPNIVDIESATMLPKVTKNKRPVVFYSPSSPYGVADHRWNSKGKPEVLKVLLSIQKKVDFEIRLVENTPYEECMQIKRDSDIVIDDITTGSFHLSALEGLSMGKPTISFLDSRAVAVCSTLTRSRDLPFVNVRLKELERPLTELLVDQSLRECVGSYSRHWMESHYNVHQNIGIYVDLYDEILSKDIHPEVITDTDEYFKAKDFLFREVNDYIWNDYFAPEINETRLTILLKFFKNICNTNK